MRKHDQYGFDDNVRMVRTTVIDKVHTLSGWFFIKRAEEQNIDWNNLIDPGMIAVEVAIQAWADASEALPHGGLLVERMAADLDSYRESHKYRIARNEWEIGYTASPYPG